MSSNNRSRKRSANDLKRKPASRRGYDRLLIVCEGSKTEPNYLHEIRTAFRIPNAEISILPSSAGTEPMQVVECAVKKFASRGEFDIIYAVFDRDEHRTYQSALKKAAALDKQLTNDFKKKVRFHAIATKPCFELWLLLHFKDIKTSLDRNQVLLNLMKHMPKYAKGNSNTYDITKANLHIAIARAEALRTIFSQEEDHGVYTRMDELVRKMHTYNR